MVDTGLSVARSSVGVAGSFCDVVVVVVAAEIVDLLHSAVNRGVSLVPVSVSVISIGSIGTTPHQPLS